MEVRHHPLFLNFLWVLEGILLGYGSRSMRKKMEDKIVVERLEGDEEI